MSTREKKELVCIKCNKPFIVNAFQRNRKVCNVCSPKKDCVCKRCGNTFIFYGISYAYYCETCRFKTSSESVMRRRATKNLNVKLGVGSGGNQRGESNHAWNPESSYRDVRRHETYDSRGACFAIWPKICVMCSSTELIQAHHVNGNWRDDRITNIIPLCKSCHTGLHSRNTIRTQQGIEDALFSKWEEGRSKIAEKIGNPEMWESEVKARNTGWASRND